MVSSLICRCSGAQTLSERSTGDRCQFHDPVKSCGIICGKETGGKGGSNLCLAEGDFASVYKYVIDIFIDDPNEELLGLKKV